MQHNDLNLYVKDAILTRLCLDDGCTFVTAELNIRTSNPKSPKFDEIYERIKSSPQMVGLDIQVTEVDQSTVETMLEIAAKNSDLITENSSQKTSELGARLAAVCQTAVELNTSDIHIEIHKEQTRYLMRVDGERELLKQFSNGESAEHRPREDGTSLISYVFSTLGGIDAKLRDPANDRFELPLSWKGQIKSFEWRAAMIPLNRGVKLTLRCLTPRDKPLKVADMDLPAPYVATLRKYLKKRNGGIVICGPVGSGKSTLANGLICEVDAKARSVHCMEDPVEFELPFVCKTPVEPDKELKPNSNIFRDYAFYTKETLRHDVDVALIGEVRDNAAAMQFCRKGEVGGLAITTLHTNSAYGVPQTFIESLGVPAAVVGAPDLMLMFVHQRLVKKLCSCALPYLSSDTEEVYSSAGEQESYNEKRDSIHELFYTLLEGEENRYKPTADLSELKITNPLGCEKCEGKGERGRLSVMEIITLEDKDRKYIANNDIHGWLEYLDSLNWPDIATHTRSRIKNGQVDVTSASKQIDNLLTKKSNTIYQEMQDAL